MVVCFQCVGSTSIIPGDIVDNDCDGRVDEELANGIGKYFLSMNRPSYT